jgi:hypothetical protein
MSTWTRSLLHWRVIVGWQNGTDKSKTMDHAVGVGEDLWMRSSMRACRRNNCLGLARRDKLSGNPIAASPDLSLSGEKPLLSQILIHHVITHSIFSSHIHNTRQRLS